MRIVNLRPNGLGRYDDVSPFIIGDKGIELKIGLPNFNGEFYLIAENNGKTFKMLLPRDSVIVLDGLMAGELNAEVKHYLKGELIKTYKVEPLLLKEVDGMLSAVPEIIALKTGINNFKAENAHLQTNLAELDKYFEEYKQAANLRELRAKNNVLALIKFAFKDYKDNVYLGGGSIEQFIKEFGFDLSEEELKEISEVI